MKIMTTIIRPRNVQLDGLLEFVAFQSDSKVLVSDHRWKIFLTELRSISVEVGRSRRSWTKSSYSDVQLDGQLRFTVFWTDPNILGSDRYQKIFLTKLQPISVRFERNHRSWWSSSPLIRLYSKFCLRPHLLRYPAVGV